ncbi:MAG: hypothetical protein E6J04_17915 [Chloroflexi bacterium]|nr:MAG: hypothetical protein E6J04_17915 [Chloroflexota bacterium]
MPKLGYGKKWQNFEGVIKKAMVACTETGNIIELHFTDASKSSPMPHGGVREIKNYYLSRLACYLIAMNGNPRKIEIAAAQNYFAITTRTHEIHQLRMEQEQRLETRLKVSESFKLLAETATSLRAGLSEEQDLHTLACSSCARHWKNQNLAGVKPLLVTTSKQTRGPASHKRPRL